MFFDYLFSEIFLVFRSWKIFIVNFIYFVTPTLFFQIIVSSEINKNNKYFFEIISNGIFLIIFITIIQFFVFNKLYKEYNSGTTTTKFCLPIHPAKWIIIDIIAESFFIILLFGCCLLFYYLFFLPESFSKLIISGLILIPLSVCIAHTYALLFLTSNENIIISSLVSLASLLPLLFFIAKILKGVNCTQNIIIALLYSLFISLIYIMRMILNVNTVLL